MADRLHRVQCYRPRPRSNDQKGCRTTDIWKFIWLGVGREQRWICGPNSVKAKVLRYGFYLHCMINHDYIDLKVGIHKRCCPHAWLAHRWIFCSCKTCWGQGERPSSRQGGSEVLRPENDWVVIAGFVLAGALILFCSLTFLLAYRDTSTQWIVL